MDSREKAYLIGIQTHAIKRWLAEQSFDELLALALSAGLKIAGRQFIDVRPIHPATFIGSGNIRKIKSLLEDVDVVILDTMLSPSQNRNLESCWERRVIDRTSLILDIFAQHARSNEGKLQVELAQYQYLYPRLVGAWTHLSKQRGGGVGLRGPGETQLEVDRRRVKERMTHLKEKLKKVSSARQIHRKKREGVPIPTITLVGYTNAGKSTLFNALTGSAELAEDRLFATLDPKTKKLKLPSGRVVLITDTVGFIRNLPHQLIESFASTFEEARQSELLIHVIDGSHPISPHLTDVVEKVIKELRLDHIPVVNVMNKCDLSPVRLTTVGKNPVILSAMKGWGLEHLLEVIDSVLAEQILPIELFIPHPYGDKLACLYRHGRVIRCDNRADGIFVEVALPEKWRGRFEVYRLPYQRLTRPMSTCTKRLPG